MMPMLLKHGILGSAPCFIRVLIIFINHLQDASIMGVRALSYCGLNSAFTIASKTYS